MPAKRKILTIISICVLFIFAGSLGIYFWLNAQVNNIIDRETYRQLVEEINASENLPERFYEILEIVGGFDRNLTTRRAILAENLWEICPCRRLTAFVLPCPKMSADFRLYTGNDWRLYGMIFNIVAMRLYRDASPQKCLDFLLLYKWDFWHSVIGIRNASRFYFEKELEELTDDQLFKLALMAVHPGRYNIKRFPDRVKRRIEEIRANK